MRGFVIFEDLIAEADLKPQDSGAAYVTQCAERFFRGKTVESNHWCVTKDKAMQLAVRELEAERKRLQRICDDVDGDQERRVYTIMLEENYELLGKARNHELPVRWMP